MSRRLAYLVAIAATIVAAFHFPAFDSRSVLAFPGLAAALLAGGLLTLRFRGGQPGSSLIIVPIVVAQARLGAAALPLLALASLVASWLRGRGFTAGLRVATEDVVAFTAAQLTSNLLAAAVDPLTSAITFTVIFIAVRSGLHVIARLIGLLEGADPRAERPDAILSLLIAPIGALPILASGLLGDGALLLALVALLTMLTVVREAVNLGTARAEVEAERDRWEKAYALQEELTQLITHEVRNPLTTILTYADLADEALRRGSAPVENLHRHLDRIRRAGKSIGRLVDNLLQISRIEGAGQLPTPELIHLPSIAREVVAEMTPLAEQKSQSLVLDVDRGTPAVLASRTLLHEAMSNLLSNAVKYTPSGGEIRLWACPAPGGSVRLGVTDNGVGLSDEDRAHLFTKFFRSGDPRVRRERGAGLGLALTHSIVDRMGGRLTVESALNRGSTFCIELPSAGRVAAVAS